jgi:hypothetical protein
MRNVFAAKSGLSRATLRSLNVRMKSLDLEVLIKVEVKTSQINDLLAPQRCFIIHNKRQLFALKVVLLISTLVLVLAVGHGTTVTL